uniref:Uncharacterized protein n=1 Tax=Triticum urartu TaxID=4572 RepID=A0A8R7TGI7_TRIUA
MFEEMPPKTLESTRIWFDFYSWVGT